MVAFDLHARQIVSTPEWNDGLPVHLHQGGVAVRYQDARCRGGVHATWVPVGMELTLVSGGCVRGGAQ